MKSIMARAPLRDTTAWPGYREARWIPRRYGPCGGEALQYDDTRRRWVWNDGASASIDSVFTGDQPASGWEWRNGVDAAGQVVTFIEFAGAVPEGRRVVARGRGVLHPVRGGLMESPAEVLWDVLANLGGLPIPEARFSGFLQQCAAAGLTVGGSVEVDSPLHAIAREICDSVGAVCSPDLRGFARLWPGYDAPAVASVERTVGVDVSASALLADMCTDLTLRYAWEAGEPRGAVQYAVVSPPASGSQARVVDAKWLSSSRVAALVCERLLAFKSRAQWEITARGVEGDIRIGQSVALQHPLLPVGGSNLVLAREFEETNEGDVTTVTVRAAVGAVPVLALVRNTNASEALPPVPVNTTATGDEIEVQILDSAGQPVAGAECTLDSQITRFADSAGWVRFPLRYGTPGLHTIVAVATGLAPITTQFTVP